MICGRNCHKPHPLTLQQHHDGDTLVLVFLVVVYAYYCAMKFFSKRGVILSSSLHIYGSCEYTGDAQSSHVSGVCILVV